jgi:hypothetical protein
MRASIRGTLAEALLEQGEATQPVIDLIGEAVRLNSKLRNVSYLTGDMTVLAKALATTDPRGAAVLLGAARIMERRHGIGYEYLYADRDYVDHVLDQLRNRLGVDELTEAIESIEDITFDEATDLALSLAKQWKPARQPAAGTLASSEDVPEPA